MTTQEILDKNIIEWDGGDCQVDFDNLKKDIDDKLKDLQNDCDDLETQLFMANNIIEDLEKKVKQQIEKL